MGQVIGLGMVGVVLGLALWGVPTSDVMVQGAATHYAGGRMAEVVEARGWSLAGYEGGVALNRRGDLGRSVWLEWVGGPYDGVVDGPFLVVDCAQRGGDYEARLTQGYVVEVDVRWAGRREFAWIGPAPVRVWFVDPRGPEGGGRWL